MSKTEEEIQQAIRPCIEKMVIDVTNDQPKDVVRFIININNLGTLYDFMASKIWRIHYKWINSR